MEIVVRPAGRTPWLEDAVREGGGTVVDDPDEADGLVWSDPHDPEGLAALLDEHPDLPWVQLPFAGVDEFADVLDADRTWTCAKGVYAEPVAEMALGLAVACRRDLHVYARATSWGDDHGDYLLGTRVTLLGGGEISRSLLRLLGPWRTTTTVVTRHPRPIDGADEVVGSDELLEVAARSDVLVLALALTPETERIVDGAVLDALPDDAVLVNVARGEHVDTDAVVAALEEGRIGGAGLDVTDPEPLPDGHPLWTAPNVLITPHTGNTKEMARPLLAERVRENVRRRIAGDELHGVVDVELGY